MSHAEYPGPTNPPPRSQARYTEYEMRAKGEADPWCGECGLHRTYRGSLNGLCPGCDDDVKRAARAS